MSAKAKSSLTPEQRKATLRRVLEKIRPYRFFVGCSLIVAAVSVAAHLYIPILCGSAIDLMLGKGRVDFPGFFGELEAAGNNSPLSIEIEFTAKGPKDLNEVNQAVRDSAAYLLAQGFTL